MEELNAYRADLLAALEGAVHELARIVAELPVRKWHQPINHSGHSPHYILFHLRALELHVFNPQLPCILLEDTPDLPAFEDESWMAKHYCQDEPAAAILEELRQLRMHELEWLRSLSPAGWSRLARHPWWGLHTLQWWVELQADYSNAHLRELSAIREV